MNKNTSVLMYDSVNDGSADTLVIGQQLKKTRLNLVGVWASVTSMPILMFLTTPLLVISAV